MGLFSIMLVFLKKLANFGTATVILMSLVLTYAAHADDVIAIDTLLLDLDADGLDETVALSGSQELTLSIRSLDGSKLLATGREVGWINEPSDQPKLGVNGAGSLTVTSAHLNGPSKYQVSLAIAYRDGAHRVIGVNYSQWGLAFADPDKGEMHGRSCDVNLLTGNGVSNFPQAGDLKPRSIVFDAPALEDWRWNLLVDICGEGAE